MSNITQSEWDDFGQTLAKYKRNADEFDVDEKVSKPMSAYVEPHLSIITITLDKTREAKTYNAGHGSAWVVEFDDDLASGLFKF